jgi:hypothetical protein
VAFFSEHFPFVWGRGEGRRGERRRFSGLFQCDLIGLRLEKTWKLKLVQATAKKTRDLTVAAASAFYAAKPDSWT